MDSYISIIWHLKSDLFLEPFLDPSGLPFGTLFWAFGLQKWVLERKSWKMQNINSRQYIQHFWEVGHLRETSKIEKRGPGRWLFRDLFFDRKIIDFRVEQLPKKGSNLVTILNAGTLFGMPGSRFATRTLKIMILYHFWTTSVSLLDNFGGVFEQFLDTT